MSRIDNLIAEMCPEGVEFIAVEDLFETRNGYTPSKANASNWTDGTIPWFRMEDIRENGRVLGSSIQQISASAVKGGRLFPANSIIVATSATIGEHALITVPFLSNQRFTALWLKPQFVSSFDLKFVFYYCFVLDEWCRDNTTTSSFASVDMAGFKRFRFPVPPLEIQREIVRILDRFTELEAELERKLEAELSVRSTQFAYYRDSLLMFPMAEEVPRIPMGEFCGIVDGTHQTPRYTDDGVPFVSVENIASLGATKKYISIDDFETQYKVKPRTNDLLMTRIGSIGICAVVENDYPLAYYVTLALIRPKGNEVTARYLRHVIESRVGRSELWKRTLHTAVPIKINLGDIGKVLIPVPPRAEQDRIVEMLDKFEASLRDLSIALPAELNARRQQYDYIRDRLLTFPEAA
ncbi:MAG: restriction endonuclease subunit S [Gaiellaceae bacterium]